MTKLAYLGTGDFAVPALEALAAAGYEFAAVISQPDRPAGRGKKVKATPVRAAAERLGLRHIQTDDVNGLDLRDTFEGAELGVVAAFGQKIGAPVLKHLPRGCVNIHGSLLPKFRGAAPYQWAILSGEAATGVTIFQLDESWDTGAVWHQRATPIDPRETADELHDRLATLGASALLECLPRIFSDEARPAGQDHSRATTAPKLSRADGTVDFTQPAEAVVRRIHGLWSWPAAAVTYAAASGKHERLLLARAEVAEAAPPAESASASEPGAFRPDGTVQCGGGSVVRLLEVKPAGGKLMAFEAFANGRQIAPPDRLLPPEDA